MGNNGPGAALGRFQHMEFAPIRKAGCAMVAYARTSESEEIRVSQRNSKISLDAMDFKTLNKRG